MHRNGPRRFSSQIFTRYKKQSFFKINLSTAIFIIKMVHVSIAVSTGGKRLICKAQSWYSAFDIKNNWRLCRVPKLTLDSRSEKDGVARYEQYKHDRRQFNDSKVTYSKPGLADAEEKTHISMWNRYDGILELSVITCEFDIF